MIFSFYLKFLWKGVSVSSPSLFLFFLSLLLPYIFHTTSLKLRSLINILFKSKRSAWEYLSWSTVAAITKSHRLGGNFLTVREAERDQCSSMVGFWWKLSFWLADGYLLCAELKAQRLDHPCQIRHLEILGEIGGGMADMEGGSGR